MCSPSSGDLWGPCCCQLWPLPIDTGDIVANRSTRMPQRQHKTHRARWETPVEAQLRDVAFLMILALLFVLTLQILWLTSDEGRQRHREDE